MASFDRGGVTALNYQLPQVQPTPTSAGPAPLQDNLEALQGIQHVNGVTNDYYKKVQDLKSFLQDVNNNYGIDARIPDMSRPESIKLNEIYRTALSDILAQGNLLKNSQGERSMLIQRGDRFVTDPNTKPVSSMTPGVDFFPTAAAANTTEINNLTQQPSYTDEEQAQKQAEYEKAVNYWDEQTRLHPEKREFNEYQKSILTKPARATKMWAPRDTYQDRNWGRKVQTAGNILKKITNLADGAHDSFNPDPKDLNANGKPYLISKEFYGQKIGDGIVSKWKYDPDTQETEIVFQDGRSENVSSQDPRTITSQLTKTDPNAIEEYVRRNELDDEYGQVNKGKLLGDDYQKLKDKNKAKSEKLSKTTGPAVDALTEKLKAMKSRMIGSNDVVNAGKFEIEKNWGDDAFIIRNLQNVVPPTSFKNEKAAKAFYNSYKKWPDNDPDELIKWLIKNGAHIDDWKSKNGQPLDSTPASSETEAQRILREFREKNKKSGAYSPNTQKALDAFKAQVGREPSATELAKLTKKYT